MQLKIGLRPFPNWDEQKDLVVQWDLSPLRDWKDFLYIKRQWTPPPSKAREKVTRESHDELRNFGLTAFRPSRIAASGTDARPPRASASGGIKLFHAFRGKRTTVSPPRAIPSRVTEGVVGVEIGSVSLVTVEVVEFTQRFVTLKCVQNAQKSAMLAVFKVNVSKFWRVSREISWGVEL
ncbi:hypothetical protein C8J57DRAFT_1213965 [Mycena rebaudengoi]|nr:hypothetical protein C8J57DRAFT_1213965 [Mycena rebaudengoi]